MLSTIEAFRKARINVIAEFTKTLLGKKVLEVGCGTGAMTITFSNAGCKVLGIDIIDKRNPEFLSRYDFMIADARSLPFNDETFDAVVSFDVIEHIDEDELFLNKVYFVCKKGGTLILGTPNRNRLSNKLRKLLGRKIVYPLKLDNDCVHLREYALDELRELVQKAGFKVIKMEYIWFGLLGLGGFAHFPSFLNKWVQYLVIFATRA